MIRLVYYVNRTGERCIALLRRGFACTTAELPREIKTRCHAMQVYEAQLYDAHSGAAEIMLADAKRRGWKEKAR